MLGGPLQALREIVPHLSNDHFCVVGGLAASLYRDTPRLTQDLDIALLSHDLAAARKRAEELVIALGLEPAVGWIDCSRRPEQDPLIMVTGKHPRSENPVLDILLPSLPWVKNAVLRAARNEIDFNFALVPTIAPEDLILAKLYAFALSPDRFIDLDDLKNIFNQKDPLDLIYLVSEMERLELVIPEPLAPFAPPALRLHAARSGLSALKRRHVED